MENTYYDFFNGQLELDEKLVNQYYRYYDSLSYDLPSVGRVSLDLHLGAGSSKTIRWIYKHNGRCGHVLLQLVQQDHKRSTFLCQRVNYRIHFGFRVTNGSH